MTLKDLLQEQEEILTESHKFTKILKYLYGINISTNGMAILTAENPMGDQASKDDNKNSMKELEKVLQSKKQGYFKLQGTYGIKENSLFVVNISEEEAIELGRKYKQESVISIIPGDWTDNEEPLYALVMIDYKHSTEQIFKNEQILSRSFTKLASNVTDYFSSINGENFSIDFNFDPNSMTADEAKGKINTFIDNQKSINIDLKQKTS